MQTDFFEQVVPQEGTAQGAEDGRRVFLYDGQVFEDPGPEYSIQDVLNFLAGTYPELANGAWHNRTLPDGTTEITFVKVTGEKGSQAGFFEQHSPPLLPGPAPQTGGRDANQATPPAPRRVFLYDGQVFEDPGPEYSIQDVLNFLAGTYPELANGAWHNRTLPDGTAEITFVKVTGEKGGTDGD